jgi:hypothetical protein
MKNSLTGILLVTMAIMVLAFVGCPNKPTGTPAHDYDNAVITLYRSACFGRCPDYSLKIEGNGKVTYQGNHFVKVEGLQTAEISKAQVKILVDEFFAIDYFGLQDVYDTDITDIPHTETSIHVDGKQKTVYDRYGGPEKLHALEAKIDSITNSKQWVETAPLK